MRFLRRGPESAAERTAIRRHYETFWSGARIEYVTVQQPSRVMERLPDFEVARIDPPSSATAITASIGGWRARPDGPDSFELVIASRAHDPALDTYLSMLAYYQTEQHLDVGHLVPIGQPFVAGSPLTHFLISLPYVWGPRLEHCEIGSRHVRVLWAVPIHPLERRFYLANGLDALEQRFEERGLNYLEPMRASLVDADEVPPAD